MKQIGVEKSSLETCVNEAQRQRVVITRKGKPVALLIGVARMDREQLQLGNNDKFWELITKRRAQKAIDRSKLEERLSSRK